MKDEERQIKLHAKMMSMPGYWRYRWCEPGPLGCGCMGCANISGGAAMGFLKEDWEEWVRNNPQPNVQKMVDYKFTKD